MVVNFTIPAPLALRIDDAIEKKGFSSKAEFFRFAAIYILDIVDHEQYEEQRFDSLSQKLEKAILEKLNSKTLPTLEKQLKDL